jgi:hypothetical protein
MIKKFKIVVLSAITLLLFNVAQAQEPYKVGIGGTVCSLNGVSFKMFIRPKLALQAELGYKWGVYPFFGTNNYYLRGYKSYLGTFELNPNMFYQSNIKEFGAGRIDWLVGGGLSIGYLFGGYGYGYGYGYSYRYGKFGIDVAGGVEFTFAKIPLALQADFRPGYGLQFRPDVHLSYFDWSLNVSARYCFGK